MVTNIREGSRVVRSYTWGAAVVVFLVAGAAPASQLAPHESHSEIKAIPLGVLEAPATRRDGIGSAHERVSTTSHDAQTWYDQGLAHLHSFAWIEAARAFHAALRADAQLAMAHLGLSLAYGGLGSSAGAADELQRARELDTRPGAHDELRIALRAMQLSTIAHPDDGAIVNDYRSALDRALTMYPGDVELLLLRGQAEDAAGDPSGMSGGGGAVPFYMRANRAAPDQFAPHHYLAHAYENTGLIDLALEQSRAYVRLAPGVAHAHHMYGHGLWRAGSPMEAIGQFQRAAELETAQLKAAGIPFEYDWHYHHNATLLAASYRYVGQMRSAADLLRRAFDVPAPLVPEELNKRDWPAFLLARGRTADALGAAEQLAAHTSPLLRAAGHLSAAQAHLAAGRTPSAGREADAALLELRPAGAAAAVLASDLRLVQGEFFLKSGDRERGRAMIRQAVADLRARPGPDAWSQTLFDLEAAARTVREADDWTLAGELADQMRQHDSGYAGTHFALALVADRQGDRVAAVRGYKRAIVLWRDADGDLPELSKSRRRLTVLESPR
jgi:tetratricopeptide (TPR) repeat protein